MMIKLPVAVEYTAFLLIFVKSLILGVYPETGLNVSNNCSFIVWPVISVTGSPSSGFGFALQNGESRVFSRLSQWTGRLWGRTGCFESSSGKFMCETGGCTNGTLNCTGDNAMTSVTLAEFTLSQGTSLVDFYDISLVDGYNLPILVTPNGSNSCRETGCVEDLNRFCPRELQVLTNDGDIVGCQSPCSRFGTPEYCCTNGPCKSTNYSDVFKKVCPTAYSYPQDDETSTFACPSGAANYTVTFCASLTNITGSPPSHQGATGPSPAPRQGTPTSPSSAPGTATSPSFGQGTPASPSSAPGTATSPSFGQGTPTPPSSGQGTPTSPSFGQGTPTLPSSGRGTSISIIAGVVSAIVLLVMVIGLIIWQKIKKEKRETKMLQELLTFEGHSETRGHKRNGAKNHDLQLFSYETILFATCNFSSDNKLGEGGFGTVYKGKTSEGQDLAVKLLSKQSGQGLLEFKTELILISKLQHVNLVKLHGLCIHGDDKMIIYDYMPNKSLDFFLFDPSKKEQLNWPRRFNIIEGIAQGLLYLHKYSRLKIIHRDLKPSNILLDENMNAKISDFGLARVFEQNIDEANTNRRVGTYGYMAPEYAMQGIFSVKSDVYSFGVLVLEIASGRKNNCFHQIEGPLNLVEYAWELWRNDSTLQLMDPTLQDSCINQQVQRCIHIALLCVENRAVDRPSIEDVMLMLKSETKSLPVPKNPSFIARNFVQGDVKKSIRETSTQNDVTLSEIEGR